jgi:hypothetical protein
MRTLYVEGVAIHDGPEPCVGTREGVGEALDRGTCRPAIEREIMVFGVLTLSKEAEGNIGGGAIASRRRTSRGQRTCACTKSLCARTGRSRTRLPG